MDQALGRKQNAMSKQQAAMPRGSTLALLRAGTPRTVVCGVTLASSCAGTPCKSSGAPIAVRTPIVGGVLTSRQQER
jgi:hypothetical protein